MSTTTVDLDADQQEIRDGARRFLQNEYDIATVREVMEGPDEAATGRWGELVEMGWTGIAVGEDHGGAGFGDVERCVLLEEMGRHLMPGPFLSSAVLASDALEALADAGSSAAGELLAGLVGGERRAALAAAGDLNGGDALAGSVVASGTGDGATLTGDAGIVVDGGTADVLVVAAALEQGGVGVFAVQADASGVSREPAVLVDATRRAATVQLDGAPATALCAGDGSGEAALRGASRRSAVALAAEQVGAARQALDLTITYLNDRQQFGVPIGSFQGLKHRATDASLAVTAARESMLDAADALSGDDEESILRAVSAAQAAASDAAVLATAECIQFHGGIGFTHEADIGLYYKRAVLDAGILGSSDLHRERLSASLGL